MGLFSFLTVPASSGLILLFSFTIFFSKWQLKMTFV